MSKTVDEYTLLYKPCPKCKYNKAKTYTENICTNKTDTHVHYKYIVNFRCMSCGHLWKNVNSII